jgi:phosphoglycerol geranylgeranyltransferase
LIDPDRTPEHQSIALAEACEECGVDAILMGTSFMLNTDFAGAVRRVKKVTRLPVVIFPGSFAQITPDADAILFTSLISGRNPQYLIDEQVKGAPLVKRCGIEPIPTGYMLIESGSMTSVQFISGSMPIPREKVDIACAHALAAEYMGMKLVYLEAGSGAMISVSVEMVRTVAEYIDIPVMVGGGLREPRQCETLVQAGASFVVVGNQLESEVDLAYLKELADAVHSTKSIGV